MGRIVIVRDGKGNVFKMDEDLLEGEPANLSEEEINNLPRLDISSYLERGYISASDYRKQIENKVQIKEGVTIRSIDEEKYVTLEEFMERTAYIEEGHSDE